MGTMALEPQTNNPIPKQTRMDIMVISDRISEWTTQDFDSLGQSKTALSCIIDDLMLIHNQLE